MAAGVEGLGEAAVVQSPETDTAADTAANGNAESVENVDKESDSKKSEFKMQEIADMLSKLKLNPMAKEFFPSSYLVIGPNRDQFGLADGFSPVNNQLFGDDGYPNNRRRRNNYNQGRRRLNGRAFRAQREESIRRTVYVSELDHNVTEEQLADLFSSKCGQVVDCRICGDPHSRLHFAFVEFADEVSAGEALNFGGTLIGFYPIKVLPSKTAILPVNPTFLPRSEDEREMCARTVYCTNIDKEISQAAVKFFFESYCGEVSRLRLLGDNVHSTRIAFVEFAMAESAIAALDCSGRILGTQPIRNAEPVKITFINTQYVETDATSFKSVVQKLTGKDSKIAAEPKLGRVRSKVGMSRGGTGGVGSGLSRGMSFKDFDRLLTELPPLDELYRLCSDGI